MASAISRAEISALLEFVTRTLFVLLLGACASQPYQPAKVTIPDLEVTREDFLERLKCINRELGNLVKATDSETTLLRHASVATGGCSLDLWRKLLHQQPFSIRDRQELVEKSFGYRTMG